MAAPFVRSAYNYDVDKASNDSGLKCQDKSLAKQEFAEECDINTIVKRFGIGYEIPTGVRVPEYADFDQVSDFHSAMNAVRMASESFMAMSAETRLRFNNDAGLFVEFCSKPENIEEMRKLGLAVAPPAPVVAPPAPPAAPPAPPVAP